MITDCFDTETQPFSTLYDFYGEPGNFVDTCLLIFSYRLVEHLLATFPCEKISELKSCNGCRPIYMFTYKHKKIAFYMTMPSSSMATAMAEEAAWVTGAKNFIMFGSCGNLNPEATKGKFILPTESYRGEGCSYYYAPPADYISIPNSQWMGNFFREHSIPYIQGRVWTTDSFGRETKGLVAKRQAEGCLAVEMELAGVQAMCNFNGYKLYPFLEPGDVLADSGYEVEGLSKANHNLAKLYIALDIAVSL